MKSNSDTKQETHNTTDSSPSSLHCCSYLWRGCRNSCTSQCWRSVFVSVPLFAVLWTFIVMTLISKLSLQFHHIDYGLNNLGIKIDIMVDVFEWMIGLTISGNMVAIIIDALLGTNENVDKLVMTYQLNEGGYCCTWMITKFINILLTFGFLIAWTNIFFVLILTLISISMLASIFMSNTICTTTELTENQIISTINNAFSEFHDIVAFYWGQSAIEVNSIDSTTVDGFCRLWSFYQVDLMNNAVLSTLIVVIQANIAIACFRRCLLALHRIEKIQIMDSQEKEIIDMFERTKSK